jgi:hypothetical protein
MGCGRGKIGLTSNGENRYTAAPLVQGGDWRISVTTGRFFAFCVSVGAIGGAWGWWTMSALGQIEAAPATTVAPPQQIPVYGVPAAYPSPTAPTTATAAAPSTSALPGLSIASAPASPIGFGESRPAAANLAAQDSNSLYAPSDSPGGATAAAPVNSGAPWLERPGVADGDIGWQVAPAGLMYRSYLAGEREPRLATQWVHERRLGWLWCPVAGGRAGLLRYGTYDDLYPQGWQLDIEGGAFPRINQDEAGDVVTCDFRCGLVSTARQGPWETKFGYYHVSSHLCDEYIMRHPDALTTRINYVRNSLVLGTALHAWPGVRLYGEAGWCFQEDGGARPWEFQFGVEWTATDQPTGARGEPFLAINGHLRQENNFGGNMTVQTGWLWRGRTGHTCRIGMEYFNGMSDQYEFYSQFEEQIGMGLWFDF